MTRKIKLAYIISLLARIATETVFIIIGMELYNLNVRLIFIMFKVTTIDFKRADRVAKILNILLK